MDYLDILQSLNNILYSIFGDRKFVINFQVHINEKRFELDKIDVNEIIAEDDDGKYVQ